MLAFAVANFHQGFDHFVDDCGTNFSEKLKSSIQTFKLCSVMDNNHDSTNYHMKKGNDDVMNFETFRSHISTITFIGLLAVQDPPRPEAKEAIALSRVDARITITEQCHNKVAAHLIFSID